jgi:hypothetical protein
MMAFKPLDLLMINGMPLREISVVEARRWGDTHDRDGRFLNLLLYGVPDQGGWATTLTMLMSTKP